MDYGTLKIYSGKPDDPDAKLLVTRQLSSSDIWVTVGTFDPGDRSGSVTICRVDHMGRRYQGTVEELFADPDLPAAVAECLRRDHQSEAV